VGTMPDAELLDLAGADKLPGCGLTQQVGECWMIRARETSPTFVGRGSVRRRSAEERAPTHELQHYYARGGGRIAAGAVLLFEHLLSEAGRAGAADSDYSFLTERLSSTRWTVRWRSRDSFRGEAADDRRAGVLGMAGVLAMISTTGVVFRCCAGPGCSIRCWGLRYASAGCSAFGRQPGTRRGSRCARFWRGIRRTPCATCHNVMDPIGFGIGLKTGWGAGDAESNGARWRQSA
jgi:hypothetical protein